MRKVLLLVISLLSISCCFIISLFSCGTPQIKKRVIYHSSYGQNYTSVKNSLKEKNASFIKQSYLSNWNGINFSNQHELKSIFQNRANVSKYKLLLQQNIYPARRLPDSLIIGVKKGGTRALLEFIRLHPNVRAASFEVHFFDRNYRNGEQWYARRMPPTLEGQITIEKTPSYFITQSVPARIKRMNPSAKLIVVVRDPVTRAISDYTQALSKKNNPLTHSFEQLAFLNGTNQVDENWGPIKIGLYAKNLEFWLKYFPLSQFLFVSGERLIIDPAAEIIRVQEFLDLKCIINEKYFYFNASKGFPCLFKSEGRSKPHCLGKTKGRNHPLIRADIVKRLYEFYHPHNEKFYKITGIHFGWSSSLNNT